MKGNLDLITCPACGASFKSSQLDVRKKLIICPYCGYEIKRLDIFPSDFDAFTRKKI